MLSVSNFSITHRHSLRFLGLVLYQLLFFFFGQIKGVVLEPERCHFCKSYSFSASLNSIQIPFRRMLNVEMSLETRSHLF